MKEKQINQWLAFFKSMKLETMDDKAKTELIVKMATTMKAWANSLLNRKESSEAQKSFMESLK